MGKCFGTGRVHVGSGQSSSEKNSGGNPVKILIVGPKDSGKTYLLYAWVLGIKGMVATKPTETFNVEIIHSKSGRKFMVWDLSGQPSQIQRQRQFYEGTQGVVFVVDSTVIGQDESAKNDLQVIADSHVLIDVPVLVVANRQNLPDATSPQQIESMLDLERILQSRKWQVCSLHDESQEDVDQIPQELERLLGDTDKN